MITLPPRNYTSGSNSTYNNTVSSNLRTPISAGDQLLYKDLTFFFSNFLSNFQINDYVAGYHDGALLFGKVLRERMLARQRGSADVPLSYNPFGNASFYGAYDQ